MSTNSRPQCQAPDCEPCARLRHPSQANAEYEMAVRLQALWYMAGFEFGSDKTPDSTGRENGGTR